MILLESLRRDGFAESGFAKRSRGVGRGAHLWGAALGALMTVGWGAGLGCSVEPSSETGVSFVPHCGDDQGDLTCEQLRRGKPFCDLCRPASNDQGCAAQRPSVPACRVGGANGTGTFTTTTTSSTGTGDETPNTLDTLDTMGSDSTAAADDTSSSSSGGPQVPCDSADGTLDDACEDRDATRPYCVAQSCVSCNGAGGDSFCADDDVAAPACSAETGQCAPCGDVKTFACGDATPVCATEGSCLACTSHSECPTSACHLDPSDPLAGRCFGDDQVLFVDADAVCPGAGTEESPNCSLAAAVASVAEGDQRVIRVAGGTVYDETAIFAADTTIVLLGTGGPTVTGNGAGDAALEISDGRVYLDGIRIADNDAGAGIACSTARLVVQRSAVGDNADYGINTSGPCSISLSASNVFGNDGGGIRMLGGDLELTNSAVGHNGNGARGPGVNLQFASLQALYATIAGNDGVGNDSIQCLEATGAVRNSIVVGQNTGSVALDCFTFDFDTNAIDTASFAGSGGTHVTDAYNPVWFNGANAGDFRLGAPPLTPFFGDVAVWEDGDPLLDADGTERPVGGVPGFAGVDEPG